MIFDLYFEKLLSLESPSTCYMQPAQAKHRHRPSTRISLELGTDRAYTTLSRPSSHDIDQDQSRAGTGQEHKTGLTAGAQSGPHQRRVLTAARRTGLRQTPIHHGGVVLPAAIPPQPTAPDSRPNRLSRLFLHCLFASPGTGRCRWPARAPAATAGRPRGSGHSLPPPAAAQARTLGASSTAVPMACGYTYNRLCANSLRV